jgi:hypothetical protein
VLTAFLGATTAKAKFGRKGTEPDGDDEEGKREGGGGVGEGVGGEPALSSLSLSKESAERAAPQRVPTGQPSSSKAESIMNFLSN